MFSVYPNLPIDAQRWLMAGRPKTGKSYFAGTFPRPWVVNADAKSNEGLYERASGGTAIVKTVSNYSAYKGVMADAKRQVSRWQTLVVDVIDRVGTWIDREVCESKGKFTIADFDHGAGYERQLQKFIATLDEIWAVGESNPNLKAIVVIAHCGRGEDGESLILRSRLAKYLQGCCEHIGYSVKERDRATGRFRCLVDLSGSSNVEAGSRAQELQESGTIGNDYVNVAACFPEVFKVPTQEQYDGAMSWLEKGGVSQNQLEEFVKFQTGSVSNVAAYTFNIVRRMSKDRALFDEVRGALKG